ncbi:MAG: hypothetical protein RLZ98_190 [Pseudomonadota bacterium]|jgi:MFS family permease
MTGSGWGVLRHRDFSLVCGARFANTLANHIIQVAIAWYVYDVTGDAFALAYLGLAAFVPAVLLVLFTGYIADHFDRRLLMMGASLVFTLSALALLLVVASGSNLIWPIYLVVIFVSGSRSFFNTASRAIVPSLVPKDQLANGVAFASGAEQAATIAGPALGGILYLFGSLFPFTTATVTLAAAMVAAFLVRFRDIPQKASEPVSFKVLAAGFTFMRSKPVVLAAISLDAFVGLLSNVVILLPIYAKDILHVGPVGHGFLRTAPAVGALLMAMWLANNQFVKRQSGAKMLISVGVFGVATLVFGFSYSFYLSLLALAIVGASDMVSVVIRHTLIQADTPNELRGRVSSVNSLFTSASSELGRARAGLLAGLFGPVASVAIGGIAALAITALWPVLFKDLWRRDHLVEEDTQPATAKS